MGIVAHIPCTKKVEATDHESAWPPQWDTVLKNKTNKQQPQQKTIVIAPKS